MVAAGGGLAGLAADGDLAGMEVAGRAAAACGTSTGPAAMEEKGQAGACRREKLGALVGWGDGDHLSFSDRSGQGHGSITKGWGRAAVWSHARLQSTRRILRMRLIKMNKEVTVKEEELDAAEDVDDQPLCHKYGSPLNYLHCLYTAVSEQRRSAQSSAVEAPNKAHVRKSCSFQQQQQKGWMEHQGPLV